MYPTVCSGWIEEKSAYHRAVLPILRNGRQTCWNRNGVSCITVLNGWSRKASGRIAASRHVLNVTWRDWPACVDLVAWGVGDFGVLGNGRMKALACRH